VSKHKILGTALAAATATLAADAKALGPVEVEAGVKVGAATNPFSADPNPLGLGLGGRAGLSFLHIYGGVSVIDYFGGTKSPQLGSPAQVEDHSLLYGIEAGYGFELLELLTVRPLLGIGNYTLKSTIGGADLSTSNLYLEPSLVGLFALKPLFVGVDVGALILPGLVQGEQPSKTYSSISLHAQAGVKF
jgi:hypothetical protein